MSAADVGVVALIGAVAIVGVEALAKVDPDIGIEEGGCTGGTD